MRHILSHFAYISFCVKKEINLSVIDQFVIGLYLAFHEISHVYKRCTAKQQTVLIGQHFLYPTAQPHGSSVRYAELQLKELLESLNP